MNELAKELNEDNQAFRAVVNYLTAAHSQVNKSEWDDIDGDLHNYKDFYSFVKAVCEHQLNSITMQEIHADSL